MIEIFDAEYRVYFEINKSIESIIFVIFTKVLYDNNVNVIY